MKNERFWRIHKEQFLGPNLEYSNKHGSTEQTDA